MSNAHFPNTLQTSKELRLIDVRAGLRPPHMPSAKEVVELQLTRLSFITHRCGTQNILVVNRPLAIRYACMGARALKKGDALKAESLFRKAIAADSSYSVAHAGLGSALFMLGKKKAALACYDRAITQDPNRYKYYNNRGIIRTEVKKFVLARKDLAKAIKINPKKASAFFHLGAVSLKEKKYTEAIRYLKEAEARGLKSADLYFLRGKALQGLGKYRQALVSYGKALKLAPSSKEIMKKCNEVITILTKKKPAPRPTK